MNETLTDDQIADFMHRWAGAVVSNDSTQTNQFVTPDWSLIDRPGIISLDRFNEVVANGALQHTEMSHDIVHIRRISTDAVIVVTHGQNTGTYEGQAIHADEWTLDVLVNTPAGWRCALTQLTPRNPDES